VLSEARRGSREARDWLRGIDADEVFLSVVTLGEIMKGVRMKAARDPAAGLALERWLDQLRENHDRRILPIGDAIALRWGEIAGGRPRGMTDALIAATALVHRKTLVTRNTTDFADLGLRLVNPWATA
jgi:predicted nucleic acid-binding protein